MCSLVALCFFCSAFGTLLAPHCALLGSGEHTNQSHCQDHNESADADHSPHHSGHESNATPENDDPRTAHCPEGLTCCSVRPPAPDAPLLAIVLRSASSLEVAPQALISDHLGRLSFLPPGAIRPVATPPPLFGLSADQQAVLATFLI